jgi:hypothetical protein
MKSTVNWDGVAIASLGWLINIQLVCFYIDISFVGPPGSSKYRIMLALALL